MRIAVIASSYPRYEGDGTAPFVKSISESLYQIGNEVEVVAPFDPLVVENTPNLVKVHRFKYALGKNSHIMGHAKALDSDIKLKKSVYFLLPFFVIASFIKLLQVTKKQKTQIIHAHWVIPNGLPALIVSKIRKIPLVVSLHGSDIFVAKQNWYFGIVTKLIFKNTSFVSACSQNLIDEAIKLGAPKNIRLIPWGADPQKFFKKVENFPNKYNFRENKEQIIFLGLGRLVHKKGYSLLLKALPIILKNNDNIKLILGGEGPLMDELVRLTIELHIDNYVSFLGKVDWNDVVDFFNSGDLFIQPSIKDKAGNMDGLPTVILEAMACSLPIIASDIGGINIVIRNGYNGIIIPPNDSNKLAESIISLINDKNRLMVFGKRSRELIEREYNWFSVAKIFNSEFTNLVKN
jgi:glycosyltransferase involved in cell wall biosynthesis